MSRKKSISTEPAASPEAAPLVVEATETAIQQADTAPADDAGEPTATEPAASPEAAPLVVAGYPDALTPFWQIAFADGERVYLRRANDGAGDAFVLGQLPALIRDGAVQLWLRGEVPMLVNTGLIATVREVFFRHGQLM